MPNTYVPIKTETLTSNTATVTFSNIPTTYTDLVFIIDGKAHYTGPTYIAIGIRFNSDSGTNYGEQTLYSASWTSSTTGQSLNRTSGLSHMSADTSVDGRFSASRIDINDYNDTTKFKSVLVRAVCFAETADNAIIMTPFTWRNTAAITQISFTNLDSATGFFTGTAFALYGIKRF